MVRSLHHRHSEEVTRGEYQPRAPSCPSPPYMPIKSPVFLVYMAPVSSSDLMAPPAHWLSLINTLKLHVEILEGIILDPFGQIYTQYLLPTWYCPEILIEKYTKEELVQKATFAK